MAAIGKIREQSTLLLIVIGGAMVAFILSDIFSTRGSSAADQYVGEVYGEEINLMDYEKRVEAQKQSLASINQPVSSSAEQQIRNQVWNNMIQEKILYQELNELGLRLGQDEFDDVRFGENVRPEFSGDENFKNKETGQFDPKMVQNYFSFLQQQYPLFYEAQVNRVVNERLYEKYNNLVKMGLFVNTLEAKDAYRREDKTVTFSYAAKTYLSVADSTIEVSDSELKSYFKKHEEEKRFDRDGAASVKFVVFEVEPTEEDEAAIIEDLSTLKKDFENAGNDSLFVLKYSSTKNAIPTEITATDNPELQQMIDSAKVGDVIGPYKNGTQYAIAKITINGLKPESTVRHILLSNQTEPDMKKLKARADSIKMVIQKKKNFDEMVTAFSEDPVSVQNGGKYEWFSKGTMVKPFEEASFDKPIGSLNVIETDYGVHIVEPLERREINTVEGLVISEDIVPSNQTFNESYDEANEFSISASDAKGMVKLAEEKGYELKESKELSTQSRNLPGIAGSTDAVRWAHDEKNASGKVSQPFEFDRKIVVVGLEKRRKAGRASFEDVKEDIKPEVIKEKKVEMFKEQMSGKSLEQLQNSMNLEVQRAANVSEAKPNLTGGGNEPYVVGYAISMTKGDVSPPLEGTRAVYVIQLESKTELQPMDDYTTFRDELEENRQSSVSTYNSGVYKALKDFANVKDERSIVY